MENVFETAVKFIEQQKKDNPRVWNNLGIACTSNEIQNVFYWNYYTLLYDIPLINKKTLERAGYVLISESRELPPVIEYATEGLSLKEQIDVLINPAKVSLRIEATTVKYHFISSMEMYVELKETPTDNIILLNVPNLFTLDDLQEHVQRVPADVFQPDKIEAYWNALDDEDSESPSKIELTRVKPIRYQQNYKVYPPVHKEVSGCAPVAWAMLLSSWKKLEEIVGKTSRIWKGSTCWNIPWPSAIKPSNPSQCNVVENTIWKLNELMETEKGETQPDKVVNGEKILKDFNLTWNFHRTESGDFSFAKKIILAGQPFIFESVGIWSSGKTGHATVAYGYDDRGNKLRVSLGWGIAFPDKWISHDQFTQFGYTYRVKGLQARDAIYEVSE